MAKSTISLSGEALPVWPKEKLFHLDPELPMAERVPPYQHNVRVLRASGCKLRPPLINSLDPAVIEARLQDNDATIARLKRIITALAEQVDSQGEASCANSNEDPDLKADPETG